MKTQREKGDVRARSAGPSWLVVATLVAALSALAVVSLRQTRQLRTLSTVSETRLAGQSWRSDALSREVARLTRQTAESTSADEKTNIASQGEPWCERAVAAYAGGVCLLQGAYIFLERQTGKPWLADDEMVQVDFTATGFVADAAGYVLTNQHVVRPWEVNQTYRDVLAAGYEGQLTELRAYFPDQPAGFDAWVAGESKEADVAVLRLELGRVQVPVLDCGAESAIRPGQTVVVLGYPTGLQSLVAAVSDDRLGPGGAPGGCGRLAETLAGKGLIAPTATRGMCGRVTDGVVVYDAATALGASGGPVIGPGGRVVAINTALLRTFGGTSFGVEIGAARELLAQVKASQAYERAGVAATY